MIRPIRRHQDRYESPLTADLRVLKAVAETGSRQGAADVLHITPASVSFRLARLYRERHIVGGMVQAVWILRSELEDLAA